jgi:hypothetical protein
MTYLLSEFLDVMDGAVDIKDTEMIQLARERMVKQALSKFSKDSPDYYTEDLSGNGTRYYDLSLLASFVTGISRVTRIQFPAPTIASSEVPTDLDLQDWDDNYRLESTRYLYLPNHEPAATQAMRITYTMPYVWSVSSTTTDVAQVGHGLSVDDYVINRSGTWAAVSTMRTATHQVSAVTDEDNFTAKIIQVNIDQEDFYAVSSLGASFCCTNIAAYYSSIGDTHIGSSLSNMRTKSVEYARRSEEYLKIYEQHVGIGEYQNAAGVTVSIGIPADATLQRTWRGPII